MKSRSIADPEDTLNYEELLRVCGTATNAFVNLAASGGIEARRLLLLGPDWTQNTSLRKCTWVGAGSSWIPRSTRFCGTIKGRLLTREQLAAPGTLRDATLYIPEYNPSYNYERTTHVRLARIPLIGRFLPKALNSVLPDWKSPSIGQLWSKGNPMRFW